MGLLETLVVGAYVYSTGIFIWFERRINRLVTNHLRHLISAEVKKQLEQPRAEEGPSQEL